MAWFTEPLMPPEPITVEANISSVGPEWLSILLKIAELEAVLEELVDAPIDVPAPGDIALLMYC